MKTLKIGAFVLTILVGAWFVAIWYGWYRMGTGYEVRAAETAPFLRKMLEEDLDYAGFKPQWLEKAWANGFREHTHLYLISGEAHGLRTALAGKGQSRASEFSSFRSGNYLGPSTAPDWWETARIDAAESTIIRGESRLWRFTWLDDHLYLVVLDF